MVDVQYLLLALPEPDALYLSRLSRSWAPYKAEEEENELCLSSFEPFLTSLCTGLTTLLINDLPPSSNPVSKGGKDVFFFHQTMASNDQSLFFYFKGKAKTILETNTGTPLLPLSDSQLQRSISSALKDGVSSGVGRSSVSGLPVDTFKDFTHMSLLLKYF